MGKAHPLRRPEKLTFLHHLNYDCLSFYQSSSGTTFGDIGSGKIVKNIPGNQPGIMNLYRWQVPLAAQPFHRLRMDLKTATGFYYINIIIPRLHNLVLTDIALSKQY